MELSDIFLLWLRVRSSCRGFKQYDISDQDLQILIRAIDCGPSAGGLRPYSIWHTESSEKKLLLQKAALNQQQISQCSSVFCIASIPSKSIEKYGERGELYAIQDATIAGMCITMAATALWLDSCWIGSIEINKVREIYDIPKEHIPLSLICIGKQR